MIHVCRGDNRRVVICYIYEQWMGITWVVCCIPATILTALMKDSVSVRPCQSDSQPVSQPAHHQLGLTLLQSPGCWWRQIRFLWRLRSGNHLWSRPVIPPVIPLARKQSQRSGHRLTQIFICLEINKIEQLGLQTLLHPFDQLQTPLYQYQYDQFSRKSSETQKARLLTAPRNN